MVRHNRDVIVRRYGLEHGYHQCDVMCILGISFAQYEVVVEEDDLAIDVFEDEEVFCCAVGLLVLLEVRNK